MRASSMPRASIPPMRTPRTQHGGILGKLLLLLVLAMAAGAAWWWWFGRFARPDEEPAKPTEIVSVLDYVDRRDLGTDPFDAMVRPDPKTGRGGGDPNAHYLRWYAEYGATLTARAAWRMFDQGAALTDLVKNQAREAHLTYLHHAQLAEYYRAKWHEASGD